jgi:small GTP-binding protein
MSFEYMKVVLVGSRKSGKTSLISTISKGVFPRRYKPSNILETSTLRFRLNNNKTAIMNVWDFGGGDYPYCYARNADGVIVLFDTTSHESYDTALKYVNSTPLHCNLVLCGSKIDKKRRVVYPSDVVDGIPYYEVTCKDTYNVHFPFLHIIRATMHDENIGLL